VVIAKHLMEFFVMTASSGDRFIARTSPNSSPAQRSDVAAAKDHLLLHTRVTYAPLAIWKDFHWTCTITSFALPVQDRLE
jgi:hypothetical protein